MPENLYRKKRIIPVSSGKGGVGKTTIALNLALNLSQFKKVLLVDLDLGTSSIRNSLNVKIDKDLYHFFKKNVGLKTIAKTLDIKNVKSKFDYKNFSFIASPDGFIDELTNLQGSMWDRFYDELNSFPADIIILDLKAGFDKFVFNFLPLTNSGLLVLSPKNPPSIFSGAELVRHTLISGFKRILEIKKQSIKEKHYNKKFEKLNEIKDAFIESGKSLEDALNENDEIEKLWLKYIKKFKINIVLNFFNGLKDSIDKVLLPFYYHLEKRITKEPNIEIYGWIVEDKEIFEKNLKKIPAVFEEEKKVKKDKFLLELQEIEKQFTGALKKKKKISKKSDIITDYIESLKEMYDFSKNKGYKENFLYISHKIIYTVEKLPHFNLGMNSLPPYNQESFNRFVSLL